MPYNPMTITIESLRQIFVVLLALSIGEAFKKFVGEKTGEQEEESVLRDRLSALIAFLLLITPFYQGMTQYLYQTYQGSSPPKPYSIFLLLDCIAFTFEASLFFVMSRALPKLQWRRFYKLILILLSADAVWGSLVWLLHKWPDQRDPRIENWLALDFAAILVFFVILRSFRLPASKWGPRLALAAMAIRTVVDYWTSWHVYFPQ